MEFVTKFYQMNPDEDELFLGSSRLENGMKVLCEKDSERMRPEEPLTDWQLAQALERNRWCVISDLQNISGKIRFVGVYEDGTKRIRAYQAEESWYVKKNSIDAASTRTARLRELMAEIFLTHEEIIKTGTQDTAEAKYFVEFHSVYLIRNFFDGR